MSMLDSVTDRARPIMEYVRHLEGLVQRYRNEQRRFHVKWFTFGLLAGAATVSAVWLLRFIAR